MGLIIRHLGQQPYESVWQDMQRFTEQRDKNTNDEIWIVQHPPVFTLGKAGKAEHLLNTGDIPVVQVDRGGQVTYHGPGQLVVYVLLDLNRLKLGIRELVTRLENCVI
ncbi:MAG: lipoyl(octanoyl) transferase LipB, partial [Gammaproteobacteria bacterium]|nr:lipoyl(octanoyl) transferase LipB [Gammaproteobacteria bacterium]